MGRLGRGRRDRLADLLKSDEGHALQSPLRIRRRGVGLGGLVTAPAVARAPGLAVQHAPKRSPGIDGRRGHQTKSDDILYIHGNRYTHRIAI